MHKEIVSYHIDGKEYRVLVVYNEMVENPLPCILVAHAWRGQDDFARNKAESLAKLGYVAVALDIYGDAIEVKTAEEAATLMMPLFYNRGELQKRMIAAFNVIKVHPKVDPSRIGGIGFCFGGLAIIELLRSGVDIRGVVSFHAVLGNEKEGKKAETVPLADNIKGSLLMLHGAEDPLVTDEDIRLTQEEFEKAGIDWQMHIYGHTYHAFTVPEACDKTFGLMYNPVSDRRSWQAMTTFFETIL
jgi:dienelactone hydrolase